MKPRVDRTLTPHDAIAVDRAGSHILHVQFIRRVSSDRRHLGHGRQRTSSMGSYSTDTSTSPQKMSHILKYGDA